MNTHHRTTAPGKKSMFHRMSWATLLLATAAMLPITNVHAQSEFPVGKKLSREQARSLGALQRVQIDGREYRVLATRTAAGGTPVTTLLDAEGVVGQTHHEVLIVEQPTERMRQQLAALTAQAATVRYYDHMDTTLLRYASLEQAIGALAQIRAALPGAEVALPVRFSVPRAQ